MFTIAIIGRPNVGKSTLFNRLAGGKFALVSDISGLTRDRRIRQANIGPMKFDVIDTAGLEETNEHAIEARMLEQTERAVAQADLSLMIIDGRVGVIADDLHYANWLRKKNCPVILVINKCEGNKAQVSGNEINKLGFGNAVKISAEHGDGMMDLYEALEPDYEKYIEDFSHLDINLKENDASDKALQIAIIGRPNAGKSTLINNIIDQERLLTGPESGITRDSIAIDWQFNQRNLRLIDTAGIRKKAKITEIVEKLSIDDCFRAVRYAHICVLLIDATMLLEKQDIAIADMMINEGRAIIVAVNKWDLIPKSQKASTLKLIQERIDDSLSQIKFVPIVTISGLKKTNIDKLLESCIEIYDIWNKRIKTHQLNNWLREVEAKHLPPIGNTGTRIRLKYITQANSRPPSFSLFTNLPEQLPKAYVKYLTNSLREYFGLPGVPIRMMLRKANNPYQNKRNKKAYNKKNITHRN